MNAAGDAVALWMRENGANDVIQAAVRPAGGGWQAVQDLSAPGLVLAPEVALDPAGDAVAAWTGRSGMHNSVEAAFRPAGGPWQPAQALSVPGQHNDSPHVALDPAGNAVAVWRGTAGNPIVRAAVRPAASGTWGPPQDVSAAGDYAYFPRVAVDAAWNAVAVWHGWNGMAYVVRAARRPAGGDWQSPQDISAGSLEGMYPDVAADPAGNAAAVWVRAVGGDQLAEAAVRPAGGAWQPPQALSAPAGAAFGARVALDAAGNVVAVWRRWNGAHYIAQAAVRSGGGWQLPAKDLSQAGRSAAGLDVALDPAGNAVTVWNRSNGTNEVVQAAAYDGAGPVLRSVSAPANGFARQRLSFSLDAFDAWSPLAVPLWSFGDGKSASGRTVRHTYARRGTYTVSLSQADALGNLSTATRLLTLRIARCFGRAATRVGTSGADRIVGTRRADVIVTLAGADRVRGRGGNDRICGGKGRDRIAGGAGNDLLNGGPGRDICSQGGGRGRLVAC